MAHVSLTTKLERAFTAVRAGMPDAGTDRQAALAFAGLLGQLARLLAVATPLVKVPLAKIVADAGTPKAAAVAILRTAGKNKIKAAKMLLDSWNKGKEWHSGVLDWLTNRERLEAEIRGSDDKPSPVLASRVPHGERLTAPDKISHAMVILSKHPDWTARRIAEAVGCSPANLSQSPKWKAARKAIKGLGQERIPHAKRHRGHDMDEYSDTGK